MSTLENHYDRGPVITEIYIDKGWRDGAIERGMAGSFTLD